MAKNSNKQDSFKEFFKKTAIPAIVFKLKNVMEDATKKIEESVQRTVSFIIKKITALSLVIFGLIFFLVLVLPSGVGFIMIGLVVMVIGFIINTFAKR